MDKEKILAKSRQEKKDEGEEFIANKGRNIGENGMILMFVILTIVSLVYGDRRTILALIAMESTYRGFESYGRYQVMKDKTTKFNMVCCLLTGIGSLFLYTMMLMR